MTIQQERNATAMYRQDWDGGNFAGDDAPVLSTLSNHELSGVLDWHDLGSEPCAPEYLNEYEESAGFQITRDNIIDFYQT